MFCVFASLAISMRSHGSLPFQLLAQALTSGVILGARPEHLQPSSLDLTITDTCFSMPGSVLPRAGETISAIIQHHQATPHSLEQPLLPGRVYYVKLAESLALPPSVHATASNKSSCGRINLRSRLLADGVASFDEVPAGFKGQLWLEVIPMSFPVRVHAGDRINQLRLFAGDARLSRLELDFLYREEPLLRDEHQTPIPATSANLGRGITMTIDLSSQEIIGWKAKPSLEHVLDTAVFSHDPTLFFEPVHRSTDGILLAPGDFFIFATKERITVPPPYAAEMIAYDGSKGEFRSHFAGFFDPGFGWNATPDERGTIAVLEVEAYSHPFFLRDGQPICLMAYEHLLAPPEKLYGADLSSNYSQQSGPRLAKWFRA